MVDARRIRRAVWALRRGCASGEGLARIAGIQRDQDEQWKDDCRVQWNRGHGEKSFCNGDSPVQRARRTTFRQRERSADTSGAGANRGRNSIAAQFSEAVVCEEVWHV